MYHRFSFAIALYVLPLFAPLSAAQSSIPGATGEDYHNLAIHMASAGRTSEAGELFRKAWEIDPTNEVYVHDLAVYYIHQHDYPRALGVITDHVKRSGPTALGWTLQGEYLFEQKQLDAAYQSLREALDLSPTNYRAHELTGLIFALHRRYGLALEELKIAVAQNPNSAQTHFYCGRLYYRMADYTAARDEFKSCLALNAVYPEATENLGLTLEALGDATGAQERYRQAIAFDKAGATPRSEFAYVCLGALLSKTGGHDKEAEDLLQNALSNNPKSAWAHFELGRLYFKQRADAAAAKHFALSGELDNRYSRPHFFLAKIYQRTARARDAETEFARFRELDADPENREPQITR